MVFHFNMLAVRVYYNTLTNACKVIEKHYTYYIQYQYITHSYAIMHNRWVCINNNFQSKFDKIKTFYAHHYSHNSNNSNITSRFHVNSDELINLKRILYSCWNHRSKNKCIIRNWIRWTILQWKAHWMDFYYVAKYYSKDVLRINIISCKNFLRKRGKNFCFIFACATSIEKYSSHQFISFSS